MPPPPHVGPPAREYPFKLDPFQQTAANALEAGHSVLVAAHTSAGKTVVAEYAFGMALRDGHKVVYTSPLKVRRQLGASQHLCSAVQCSAVRPGCFAGLRLCRDELPTACSALMLFLQALSNQKYRELQEQFGDVGLMTGGWLGGWVAGGGWRVRQQFGDEGLMMTGAWVCARQQGMQAGNAGGLRPPASAPSCVPARLALHPCPNTAAAGPVLPAYTRLLVPPVCTAGDVTINPNASCLVMTTEILRSMLYRGSEVVRQLSLIVYDEIHYLRWPSCSYF